MVELPQRMVEEAPTMIESKMMQCETCDAGVALLIFANQATDRGGFEDSARLMYPKMKELDLPTWVIGPLLGQGPPEQSPANILKVWPEREPLFQMSPDEFNEMIDVLARAHCGLAPEKVALASEIDGHVQRVLANGGGDEELMLSMADHMGTFKQLLDSATKSEMDQLGQRFDGFYRFAKLLEGLAQGLANGSVQAPK